MKLNKFFMLGMVGLAFAACSNEEEVGNLFPEGKGAVTIKIVSPTITKTISEGHDENVAVVPGEGTHVVITLTDTGDRTQTITLSASAWGNGQTVTFWNVENPQSVSVSMNGGKSEYTDSEVDADDLQKVENVPAYGETKTFTLSDRTGSPDMGNNNNGETGTETGAEKDDESTTYQIYTATINMAIPMSRLEVSGIQHITTTHTKDVCAYNELIIAGVYLDNVIPNGEGVKYNGTGFSCASGNPEDYSFTGKGSTDPEYSGTGSESPLKDAITGVNNSGPTDFLTVGGMWPASGVFGYNFFGADGVDKLPIFKIYFSSSEAKDDAHPLPAPRYAMITKYKKTTENGGGVITKFEPGHIYRITSAKLSDENIIGDEGGNTLYGVEVTVTEASWVVETIDAEWAN